ncbi:MAG: hypothetical protein KGJ98_08105 [Chloroflexota bacterium]|nr:hypothetical protein [Chloroflexota bacterium]MDE3102186.1 hypothetical protein [Chloroflexota bacterium]
MTTEEGRQVLGLLAQGKIDADQAYRLLRAIGDVREDAPPPPPSTAERGPEPAAAARGRILRIRVSEHGKPKVNVAIPLAIARVGKLGRGAGLVSQQLMKFGLDLDQLLREVETAGRIVDINDEKDRVEIFVE